MNDCHLNMSPVTILVLILKADLNLSLCQVNTILYCRGSCVGGWTGGGGTGVNGAGGLGRGGGARG